MRRARLCETGHSRFFMPSPSSIFSRELVRLTFAILSIVAVVAFEGISVSGALPEVVAELGDAHLLPWTITGFLVSSGISTVVTGGLIDAYGALRIFRYATFAFAIASLLCGLAPTMPWLIAARVLQGSAGGSMTSVAIGAVVMAYPPHLTGRAMAANSNVWAILGAGGPALAAFLLPLGGFRAIFFSMIPLAMAALWAGYDALPDAHDARRTAVDWTSLALLSTGLAALLLAISNFGLHSLLLLVAGAALLVHVVRRSQDDPDALIEARFVSRAPFAQLTGCTFLTLAATVGVETYLPIYVRGARRGSISLAAWSMFWLTIGWTLGANVAGRILGRVRPEQVLIAATSLGPPAIALAGWLIHTDGELPWLFACYALMGLVIGMTLVSALQLVKQLAPEKSMGKATSSHAFTRTLGFSVGAGLAGGVILGWARLSLADASAVQGALSGAHGALSLGPGQALSQGFALAHLTGFVLMLLAFGSALHLWRGLAHERAKSQARQTQPSTPERQ